MRVEAIEESMMDVAEKVTDVLQEIEKYSNY